MSKGLSYLAKARPEAATGLLTFYGKQVQALDDKTRFLISVVTKVCNGSERGLKQYAPKALEAGASKEELLDAVLMAFPAAGLTGILDAIHVLLELELLPDVDAAKAEDAGEEAEETGPKTYNIGKLQDYPVKASKLNIVEENVAEFLIYREDEEQVRVYYARCPHRDNPLAEADCKGMVATCPLHGWEFNLRNGENLEAGLHGLKEYDCEVVDGELLVTI